MISFLLSLHNHLVVFYLVCRWWLVLLLCGVTVQYILFSKPLLVLGTEVSLMLGCYPTGATDCMKLSTSAIVALDTHTLNGSIK
jgi:hypothetical protein